ncbi:MAG: fimbrial biogenesis chaperone [Pseudomarimonas sp.]
MTRHRVLLLLVGILQLASVEVIAGNFAVNPVRITLDSRHQPVAALTVRNTSDIATVVQAHTMQWSPGRGDDSGTDGGDGSDQLRASAELLVTPAVFTLPPHGQQVVRVGLRGRQPSATGIEGSYRLYLSEVPTPLEPGFQGLNVALRMGLPVFVAVPGTAPELALQLLPAASGTLHLQVHNSGSAHARLKRVVISDALGATVLTADLMRDVLAGQVRRFKLPMATPLATQTDLSIQLQSELGIETFVVAQPR